MINKVNQFFLVLWYPEEFKYFWSRVLKGIQICLIPMTFFYRFGFWLKKLKNINLKSKFQNSLVSNKKIPLIVIGNFTVGGTGKTPLVAALAKALVEKGFHPAIISKGYGRQDPENTWLVQSYSNPKEVGDEAFWLYQTTQVPVAVGPDRNKTIHFLIKQTQKQGQKVDFLLLDDGLQDFSIQPEVQIVVIDGQRGFGNGYCLPAGPLRESRPFERLKQMDAVVIREGYQNIDDLTKLLDSMSKNNLFELSMEPDFFQNLNKNQKISVSEWGNIFGQKPIHAVAGIGHPGRFFQSLAKLGLKILPKPFPDHHIYQNQDLFFYDEYPIILTEKDAVKCQDLDDHLKRKIWVLVTKTSVSSMETLIGLVVSKSFFRYDGQQETKGASSYAR